MEKSRLSSSRVFGILLAVAHAASASTTLPTAEVASKMEWAASDLLCMLYTTLRSVAGLIAVLIIVAAGARWVMSENDPGQRKLAKDVLISVAIGLLVITVAGALASTIMRGTVNPCS